jgi:uncharacterized SAM-binding protein YcdF (DUF218 family)
VSTAIVVLGNGGFGRDGAYRITGRCRRLVADAERLASISLPRAVVFSGWSPNGGPSEAEQMRATWRGPSVELVVEPTASRTAENAARTLPLLLERGVERAVVICTPVHLYRARFFFRRLYGPVGIETEFRVVAIPPSPHAFAWELLALPLRRRQLRAAEGEVARRVA